MSRNLQERTISDFGEQWQRFQENEGFYASLESLAELFSPLLDVTDLSGLRVAEIGSGSGRVVKMLLQAGADHIIALEPSNAFQVLRNNLSEHEDQVECLQLTGEEIPKNGALDIVFSVGVIHHIPNPVSTMRAAYGALKPGGRFAIWVYGREGNELYLSFVRPIRFFTRRLPPGALAAASWALDFPLKLYMRACRYMSLPLASYMNGIIARLSPEQRRLVIYDQLNPHYAKYYTQQEVTDLFRQGGFSNIRVKHYRGYSWSAVGYK